jgi:hypothetical protein
MKMIPRLVGYLKLYPHWYPDPASDPVANQPLRTMPGSQSISAAEALRIEEISRVITACEKDLA